MDVVIYDDTEKLSHAAAQRTVSIANEAIAARGRFSLALSGGSTPKKLFALLASAPYKDQINWTQVEIYWSDERCVPPDDPESNYQLANEILLSKVAIPASQIHRVPADAPDREAAADNYAHEIQRAFNTDAVPSIDLIQLGMGPEGHTASLFPHQSSLHEQRRLIIPVTVPKPPPARLTFTPPLLNAARHILFLVAGADKVEAVHAVLEGPYQPEEYPAQIVRPTQGEVTWMLDTAAAGHLRQKH